MEDDTEYIPPHYLCGQTCQSCFPTFPIHQASEPSISPRYHTFHATHSPRPEMNFISQQSPSQSSLDMRFLEDKFSRSLLSEASPPQSDYKTEMTPAPYHHTNMDTYDNSGAGENLFLWDTEPTALPGADFNLLPPTSPLYNEFTHPNQPDSFEYDFERQQVPATSPEIKPEYGFLFDQYRDQDYSSYPEPTVESTFSPERTIIPSLSPPNSTGSSPPDEPSNMAAASPSESKAGLCSAFGGDEATQEDDSDDESVSSEEPYARLIWRALMTTPGHKMVLKDIYEWFEKNTNKVKNADSKGWQNSIRHNLSMNAAFEGVKEPTASGNGSKRSNNAWGLTKRALREGVQSTTRYRKPGIHKKAARTEPPAPQRQASGSKGGRAAKKAAKIRRAQAVGKSMDQIQKNTGLASMRCSSDNNATVEMTPAIKYEPMEANELPGINLALSQYELESLMGCTDLLPQSPFFCHGENQLLTDISALDDRMVGQDFNS